MWAVRFMWVLSSLAIVLADSGRIKHILHKLNKPAVTSIQSPDGDIIDCVLIENQPAFDHPLLKNSKIQRIPSKNTILSTNVNKTVRQVWHQAGRSCPSGTVPVRRTLDSDIRRMEIGKYGRKAHHPPRATSKLNHSVAATAAGSRQHEHAIAYVEGVYYGAQAVINVWDPSIEGTDEFSLSQMWILSGTFNLDLNSVEAGWQVNPVLYGDRNPRFFTYWTSDSYKSSGCYNLLCEGFVQVNNHVALGGAVAPVSTLNGQQYDIHVLIFKDFVTGNWWLRYGDELIGYWPSQLFTHLATFANVIEWGGEVVNTQPNNRHTTTQMGSGKHPQAGFGQASYLKGLQVVDFTSLLRIPGNILTLSTKPNCYDIKRGSSAGSFFYGGPGLSSSCP